jgi:hypothetical protein
MRIRGGPRWVAVRMASVALALVAGMGLLSGCSKSNDTPTDGSATTGTAPADGGSAGPGATDGGGGGTGGGGTGGGGQAAKACALVTSQEATDALAGQVVTSVDSAEECLYVAGANTITVAYTTAAYDASLANSLTQLPGVTKIDGMGEAAFAITLEGVSQFHVWAKGKYLVIVLEKDGSDTATVGRTLLDKALTRF